MVDPHKAYLVYLETLEHATLEHLAQYVSVDVHFKDPLNDVFGVGAMQSVWGHIFQKLDAWQFQIIEAASVGDSCLMIWQFTANSPRHHWKFDGMSVVRFGDDGLVREHIDYWDSSAVIFSKVPILSWILSVLRRLIAPNQT